MKRLPSTIGRRPRESLQLAEATVFITGAARSLGAEVARQFHAEGAKLALVRRLAPLEHLADELGDSAEHTQQMSATSRHSTGQRPAPRNLTDRLVLAVVNLPPRRIADFVSEALVLGVPTSSSRNVVLVGPDSDVAAGSRLL